MSKEKLWSKNDDLFIRHWFHRRSHEKIARTLGRTVEKTEKRGRFLGCRGEYRSWTEKDQRYVRKSYLKIPMVQIAKRLGKHTARIHEYVQATGIFVNQRARWTQKEDRIFLRLYKTRNAREIASRMGITEWRVYNRSRKLRKTGQLNVKPRKAKDDYKVKRADRGSRKI
jgi:DNA-directed RNA polymerase specialized sigma subunit